VKKHDKQLPHAPCQQFYMHILRTQPWVQGDQSSLLVKLSAIYAQLRGQPAETAVAQVKSLAVGCSDRDTQTLLNLNSELSVAGPLRPCTLTPTKFGRFAVP
jgi:SPX domain protein involved in polyphosphate accumulation